MIFGYTLLIMVNLGLYLGNVEDIGNALNIAMFAMWILAILNLISMFAPDKGVVLNKKKLIRYAGIFFTFVTIIHSVYYGYIWAPTIWAIAVLVIYVRKQELIERQSKNV